MEEISASPAANRSDWQKVLILAAIALAMVVAAVLAYQAWSRWQSTEAPLGTESLSEAELEASHGLRVRLIGVTGGGGMIDLRLKLIDPNKARDFLQDSAHLPVAIVTEDGTRLLAADIMEDDILWEDGGILFIMLPNSGGAIEPGTPVHVEFGSVQLEPIPAQ